MNEQREIIYSRRNEILDQENISERVETTFDANISNLIDEHIDPDGVFTEEGKKEMLEYINTNLIKGKKIDYEEIEFLNNEEEIKDLLVNKVRNDYQEKMSDVPKEVKAEFEKAISLRVIDEAWTDHISAMNHLREGIGLRGYGQINPLQAYTMEGYELFDQLMAGIEAKISIYLLKAVVTQNTERKEQATNKIVHDTHIKQKGTPIKKDKKIGRNDPCPCGSGLKYKNCCGK